MEIAPRTSGIFVQMPWVGVGSVLVSMVPSGLRTAQQMSLGPRIMMPSIRACPPTLVLKRSLLVDSLGSPYGFYFPSIVTPKCDKISCLVIKRQAQGDHRTPANVLWMSMVPSSAVMMESTSARPMPLPRTALLPL